MSNLCLALDDGYAAHTLPIKTQFYFHVTKASQRLSGDVQGAIHSAIAAKTEQDGAAGDIATIPHDLTEVRPG